MKMKDALDKVYHWLMAAVAAHPKRCLFVALGIGLVVGHLV